MEDRNKGLIAFGIILLLIGLFASFYESGYVSQFYPYNWISTGYPHQTLGIVLTLVGIVFVGLGLLFPSKKTDKLPPPPSASSEAPKGDSKRCINCQAIIRSTSKVCSHCGTKQNQGQKRGSLWDEFLK